MIGGFGLFFLVNDVNFWSGGYFKAEANVGQMRFGSGIEFFSLIWQLRANISDFWSLIIELRWSILSSKVCLSFCFALKLFWEWLMRDGYFLGGRNSPKHKFLAKDFMVIFLKNQTKKIFVVSWDNK